MAEISDIHLLVNNFDTLTLPKEIKKAIKNQSKHSTKKPSAAPSQLPGLSFRKKLEPPLKTSKFSSLQRCFNLKRDSLDSSLSLLSSNLSRMRKSTLSSQETCSRLLPYAFSSNLTIPRGQSEADLPDGLCLCVYHPLYFDKRRERGEYLVPLEGVVDRGKKGQIGGFEERAKGRQLYFDVVLNLNSVRRITLPTADIVTLSKRTKRTGDKEITKKLICLGELKMFEKLKQVLGEEAQCSANSVSLFKIDGLINFKIAVSEENQKIESNISRSDLSFLLIVVCY